jgi:hypothetical protein
MAEQGADVIERFQTDLAVEHAGVEQFVLQLAARSLIAPLFGLLARLDSKTLLETTLPRLHDQVFTL